MKSYTYEFGQREESSQREGLEIYDIWYGSTYWRYTSGDVAVTYDGNVYQPAPIQRDLVLYDSNLEISNLNITFGRSQGPMTLYVAQNPILVLWVKVTRLFRDLLTEPDIIFIGQISRVSFKGLTARAQCVGFESYLKQPIPRYRWQRACNWDVFGTKCAKADTLFKVTTPLATISSDGLTLTSTDFGLQDPDFYTLGKLQFGSDYRMITYHVGNTIKIRYRMLYLIPGSSVTAYAGCDRNAETCRDKFDNIINFGGHSYIPLDNPVLWS